MDALPTQNGLIMSFVWTSDVVERARRLYLVDGYSAAETARRIGATRSAVIGKAHRMGWAEERPAALAQANLLRANRAGAVLARPRRLPREEPVATAGAVQRSRPRPWMDREPGECAWPVSGEGEYILSCCAPSGRRTYCDEHRLKLYRDRVADEPARLERIAAWVEQAEGPRRRPDAEEG